MYWSSYILAIARRRRRGGVAIITAPTDPGPIASAATTATVEDAPLDEAALAQLAPTAATVEVAPLTHVAPATKSLQGTRTSTKTRGSRGSRGGRGSSGGRGASVQGRPHLSSYAISISPCYEQRLAETDVEERQRAEDNSAQKAAEAEQGKTAILTWWPEVRTCRCCLHTYLMVAQNDGQPVHIQVLAPLYPWFRPGDSEHLIKRFGLASGYYEYFDWTNSKWFEGDLTTPRRNIKLCGVLHYRNIGVTCCDDMPVSVTGAVKRAGSELEHQPTKRLRFTPYVHRSPSCLLLSRSLYSETCALSDHLCPKRRNLPATRNFYLTTELSPAHPSLFPAHPSLSTLRPALYSSGTLHCLSTALMLANSRTSSAHPLPSLGNSRSMILHTGCPPWQMMMTRSQKSSMQIVPGQFPACVPRPPLLYQAWPEDVSLVSSARPHSPLISSNFLLLTSPPEPLSISAQLLVAPRRAAGHGCTSVTWQPGLRRGNASAVKVLVLQLHLLSRSLVIPTYVPHSARTTFLSKKSAGTPQLCNIGSRTDVNHWVYGRRSGRSGVTRLDP